MYRSIALAALAALAALTLGGCSAGTPTARSQVAAGGPDPGVEHIHGLGVDPADGVLYAASHYGLFRITQQGAASRVADRFQDTMGFTVTGPNTFLGSGHPDFQKDPGLPPRLGLIRSTDAAETWQSVSLSGTTDFHALRAAHGNVYGWDSATSSLLVSADDGRTWDTRSRLAVRDFVVSPTDADALLATTEQGLKRSTDGGRTWGSATNAPAVVVLSWSRTDGLFALAPDGTVQYSADAGVTWTARGNAGGPPEALTIDSRDGAITLYAAVDGRGVQVSADGGATFTTRFSP